MTRSESPGLFAELTAPLLAQADEFRRVPPRVKWDFEDAMLMAIGMVDAFGKREKAGRRLPPPERRELLGDLKHLLDTLTIVAQTMQKDAGCDLAHYNELWHAQLCVDQELRAMGGVGKPWDVTEDEADELTRLVTSKGPGPGRLAFSPAPAPRGDASLLD